MLCRRASRMYCACRATGHRHGAGPRQVIPPPPSIQVKDAWIRWLPAGVPAGGYATLINTGDKPVTLIGVSSAVFSGFRIHRSMARAGTMEMSPVERITID